MSARLISLNGHDDIALDRALIVVGRHLRCDARIASFRVSRRHCCLALNRDGLLVLDLDSTNGTWINGERIEDGRLCQGDELAISHYRYQLAIRDATSAEASHPPRAAGAPPGPTIELGIARPPARDLTANS